MNYVGNTNTISNLKDIKVNVDLSKVFYNKEVENNIPDDKTIRNILKKIGKFKRKMNLTAVPADIQVAGKRQLQFIIIRRTLICVYLICGKKLSPYLT
ncbi:hypothetical protein [Caloramator sp. Dgby_cultured_2]|uniref:hypothetical protein n=1 Tax=Caloramator sp. Dgby_cultured_2 TaxID=3029174 RepID=UPI00237E1720|nr:hypothetical protein [Caloramator sp. Dgby_cultured_2]WDU83251.1 hypothetical protein PWK10_00360 [Caloramator sp. Dgby_cultured_2]